MSPLHQPWGCRCPTMSPSPVLRLWRSCCASPAGPGARVGAIVSSLLSPGAAEVALCPPTTCRCPILSLSLALELWKHHRVPPPPAEVPSSLPSLAVEVSLCPSHRPWTRRHPIVCPFPALRLCRSHHVPPVVPSHPPPWPWGCGGPTVSPSLPVEVPSCPHQPGLIPSQPLPSPVQHLLTKFLKPAFCSPERQWGSETCCMAPARRGSRGSGGEGRDGAMLVRSLTASLGHLSSTRSQYGQLPPERGEGPEHRPPAAGRRC